MQSHEASEGMTVSVDITVDASEAIDVDAAIDSVTNALEEKDANYDVSGEGKNLI